MLPQLITIKRIIEHSPNVKDQWLIYDGNRRCTVLHELNGMLWCNCHQQGCQHLQAVMDFKRDPDVIFGQLAQGKGVIDPLDDVFQRVENKDKLAKCVICGRILSNPLSVALEIGPECRKRITADSNKYIKSEGEMMVVADKLKNAAKLYHNAKFQKWIVRAVLLLNAPLPEKVLRQHGNEYWGYKNRPLLYYLAAGRLNCINYYRRQLRYREINRKTQRTALDASALAQARRINH